MKKDITILIFAFLLVYFPVSTQVLQKFEASEGVTTAKNTLSSKSNVELVFVGTLLKTIDYQTMQIPIDFDFNTGLANAWLYGFKSGPNHDSLNLVAVIKLFTLMAFDASGFAPSLQINIQSTLQGYNWKKSNEMIEYFKTNSEFMDYLNSHPNRENSIISLESNSRLPFVPMNQPFWIIYLYAEPLGKLCAVDAVTGGQVICGLTDITDQQNPIQNQNVFPNPADALVNIVIPDECINQNTRFELFNHLGVLLNQSDLFSIDFSSSIMKINSTNLEPGVYLLRIITDKSVYLSKIIIRR